MNILMSTKKSTLAGKQHNSLTLHDVFRVVFILTIFVAGTTSPIRYLFESPPDDAHPGVTAMGLLAAAVYCGLACPMAIIVWIRWWRNKDLSRVNWTMRFDWAANAGGVIGTIGGIVRGSAGLTMTEGIAYFVVLAGFFALLKSHFVEYMLPTPFKVISRKEMLRAVV